MGHLYWGCVASARSRSCKAPEWTSSPSGLTSSALKVYIRLESWISRTIQKHAGGKNEAEMDFVKKNVLWPPQCVGCFSFVCFSEGFSFKRQLAIDCILFFTLSSVSCCNVMARCVLLQTSAVERNTRSLLNEAVRHTKMAGSHPPSSQVRLY